MKVVTDESFIRLLEIAFSTDDQTRFSRSEEKRGNTQSSGIVSWTTPEWIGKGDENSQSKDDSTAYNVEQCEKPYEQIAIGGGNECPEAELEEIDISDFEELDLLSDDVPESPILLTERKLTGEANQSIKLSQLVSNPVLVLPITEPAQVRTSDPVTQVQTKSQADMAEEEMLEFSCHFQDEEAYWQSIDKEELLPPLEDDFVSDSYEFMWMSPELTEPDSQPRSLPQDAAPDLENEPTQKVFIGDKILAGKNQTSLEPGSTPAAGPVIQPQAIARSLRQKFTKVVDRTVSQDRKKTSANGTRRVSVYYRDGVIDRGVINHFDPGAAFYQFRSLPNSPEPPELLDPTTLKAIFVMLPKGGEHPRKTGRLCKIRLIDGRYLKGYTNNYQSSANTFTLLPAKDGGNIEQILVFRSAVKKIWFED